jgi:hypothetical protein
MLDKVAGLARLLAVLLAIIAGVVAVGGLNVGLTLVVLGLIGGLGVKDEGAVRLFVVVLVLPSVGAALGQIPEIGDKLNAIAGNIALGAAGVAATVIALKLFSNSKSDLTGLTAK